MTLFNDSDCFQNRVGVITNTSFVIDSEKWRFLNNLCLGNSSSPFMPDFHFIGDIRLSDLCVKLGLCSSRSEFNRKLKEGAIKFGKGFNRAIKLDRDVLIDSSIPDGIEIRVKRKCCEVVVANESV